MESVLAISHQRWWLQIRPHTHTFAPPEEYPLVCSTQSQRGTQPLVPWSERDTLQPLVPWFPLKQELGWSAVAVVSCSTWPGGVHILTMDLPRRLQAFC